MKGGRLFKNSWATNASLSDLSRIEEAVRQQFDIDGSELVLVSENEGLRPGFPRLETNIVFWRNDERYRLRIFSAVADVNESDFPVAWLLPTLRDNGDADCC